MSEIKVSNELLSWVLGCECEFKEVEDNYIEFFSERLENPNVGHIGNSNSYPLLTYLINLHTFIHLAKIKGFECGYSFRVQSYCVTVSRIKSSNIFGHEFWSKDDDKPYNILQTIEALEWVAEKLGGEG